MCSWSCAGLQDGELASHRSSKHVKVGTPWEWFAAGGTSARYHMRSSLARALGVASPVSVLASNCTPLRFVSFSQRCVSAMARPVLGPAWDMPFRAMPARRTMQTLFATAGSVSDPMQPVQPAVGSADKSTRSIRSLSRKSAPAQPVAAPASDTKKAALRDDKQSTEAAQKQVRFAPAWTSYSYRYLQFSDVPHVWWPL